MPLKVTETEPKTYRDFKNGYGFEIQKRGTGLHAEDYFPIFQLVYATEPEAKAAEQAIRAAIGNPVDAQGRSSD